MNVVPDPIAAKVRHFGVWRVKSASYKESKKCGDTCADGYSTP